MAGIEVFNNSLVDNVDDLDFETCEGRKMSGYWDALIHCIAEEEI